MKQLLPLLLLGLLLFSSLAAVLPAAATSDSITAKYSNGGTADSGRYHVVHYTSGGTATAADFTSAGTGISVDDGTVYYPQAYSGGSPYTQYSAVPLTYGLVGYWPMDEGTGTKAYDLSHANNTLTAECSGASCVIPAWKSGANCPLGGTCLKFNGNTTQSSYVGSFNLAYSNTSSYTLSTWVDVNEIVNSQGDLLRYFAGCGPSFNGGFFVGYKSSQLILTSCYPTGAVSTSVSTTVSTGTPYLLTIVIGAWSGSGNQVSFYQNGAQVGTTKTVKIGSGTFSFNIGDSYAPNAPNAYFSDYRYYSRALSAQEISELYASTVPDLEQTASGTATTTWTYYQQQLQNLSAGASYTSLGQSLTASVKGDYWIDGPQNAGYTASFAGAYPLGSTPGSGAPASCVSAGVLTVLGAIAASGTCDGNRTAYVSTQTPITGTNLRYESTTAALSLHGYWQMAEEVQTGHYCTGYVYDVSKSNNTGTCFNYPEYNFGGGLNFTGASSQYVDVGNVLGGHVWAIAANVQVVGSVSADEAIVSKGADASAAQNYEMSVNTAGDLVCSYGDGTSLHSVSSSTAITGGAWFYVECAYDGSNLVAYVRGTASGTLATTSTPASSSVHFQIGAANTASFFTGSIRDVRFYNAVQTTTAALADELYRTSAAIVTKGVTYCGTETLDFYQPQVVGPTPVVVEIHGGGWNQGASSGEAEQMAEPILNQLGIAVASVNYRLIGQAAWPASIQDVDCAIRFLRANAGTYNIDPNEIVAWGSSAGGQLAGLAALAPNGGAGVYGYGTDTSYESYSSAADAAVLWFSPTNLTSSTNFSSGAWAKVTAYFGTNPSVLAAASPITYASTSVTTPVGIWTGANDTFVDATPNSVALYDKLNPTYAALQLVNNAYHSFDTQPGWGLQSPTVSQVIQDSSVWVSKLFGGKAYDPALEFSVSPPHDPGAPTSETTAYYRQDSQSLTAGQTYYSLGVEYTAGQTGSYWVDIQGYVITVSYSVTGGGSPTAPTLDYYVGGSLQTATVTGTPTGYQADSGSAWSVTPNPLTGSTAHERWQTTAPTSGTLTGTTAFAGAYQHQYQGNFSESFLGSVVGTPSAPLAYTQFGGSLSLGLTTSYQSIWVDAGTSWSVPNPYVFDTQQFIPTPVSGTMSAKLQQNVRLNGTSIEVRYSGYYPSYSGAFFNLPLFTYVSGGTSYTISLTSTYQTVPIDNGSTWSSSSPQLLDGTYWSANSTGGSETIHGGSPGKLDLQFNSTGGYQGTNNGNNLQQGQLLAAFFSINDPIIGQGWIWVVVDFIVFMAVLLYSDNALLAIAIFDIGLILSAAAYPSSIVYFAFTGIIVSVVGLLYKAYTNRPT